MILLHRYTGPWNKVWKSTKIYLEKTLKTLIFYSGNVKVVDLLIKNGINLDVKDKHGATSLMRAGEHGMIGQTQSLMSVDI